MVLFLVGNALAGTTADLQHGLVVEDDASGMKITTHLIVEEQASINAKTGALSLDVQRLRPDLRVEIDEFPVRARVQAELAGTARVIDAYLDVGPKHLFLRAGRCLLPSGRAQLTPVPLLHYQGFSPSSNASRVGREYGLMGATSGKRGQAQLGVFGDGRDDAVGARAIARGAVNVAAGVPYNEMSALGGDAPFGLTLAASGQWWTIEQVGTLVVEFAAQRGRFRLQAEGFQRTDRERGLYGQVAATLIPGRLDMGVRFDHLVGADGQKERFEAILSGYGVGPHVRVQLALRHDRAVEETVGLVNAQLWF